MSEEQQGRKRSASRESRARPWMACQNCRWDSWFFLDSGRTHCVMCQQAFDDIDTSSDCSKAKYKGSKLKSWTSCVSEARVRLRLKGFVPVGGKTAEGQLLHQTAWAIRRARYG